MACIYAIVNVVNGKRYIGSTGNFAKRKREHLKLLRSRKHHSPHLQNAFDKYGESSFIFATIEEVDDSIIIEREQHWLDSLKTYDRKNGYNIRRQAYEVPNRGEVLTDERKAQISECTKAAMDDPDIRARCGYWRGKKVPDDLIQKRADGVRAYYADNPGPWKGKTVPEALRKKRAESAKAYYAEHGHHMSGKTATDETCRKRSQSLKARYETTPHHMTGKKRGPASEDTRRKMSESIKAALAAKGPRISPMKGKTMSDEARRKLSEAHKAFYANGGKSWNDGKKMDAEYCEAARQRRLAYLYKQKNNEQPLDTSESIEES